MVAIKVLLFLATLVAVAWNVWKSVKMGRDSVGDAVIVAFNIPKAAIGLLAGLVFLIVILPSFGQVPAGHRGVVLRFGAITGQVLDEGLYMVPPFVSSVTLMDCQVHADKSTATAASRDLQNVSTEVTVNYRLDARRVAEVYRDLRNDYVARVMVPAIQEAVKASTAEFDAENLIRERPTVKARIEEFLGQRLSQHGLQVDGISITDFKFSDDFANAIEAKVTSLQLALKAKNDVEIAKNQRDATIMTAQGAAEAIRIQAQAIQSQGGKDYVALKAIEKWDGSVPQWVTGTNAVPFINMGVPK